MTLPIRRGLWTAAVAGLAGCGGDGAAAPGQDGTPDTPRVRAVAGADQGDTVLAVLPRALIVEVHDTAGVARSALVRFMSLPPIDSTRRGERAVTVCRLDAASCDLTLAVDTTNALGQAKALIRLGTVSGTARVQVSVPVLGLTDTITYTVRSGTAARLTFTTRDTSLYAGASYTVAATLRDAYGNIAPGAPLFAPLGAATSVGADGTVRAVGIGRGGAVARSGALVDTAWVSVVPRGTIVAFDVGGNSLPAGVAKVELDGSGYRHIVTTPDTYYGLYPNWTPAGQVVFEAGGYDSEWLYVADTLGNRRRVTPSDTPTRGEIFGVAAPDGAIYFAAWGGIDYGTGLWRVQAPAMTPTRIGPNPPGNANAWKASVSPDGRQLAYGDVNRGGLTILDVATGTPRVIVAQADMPRWSPRGDWIVVNDGGTLHRVRPDGTGRTQIAAAGRRYAPRADWSPDGAWLVARGSQSLELIEVSTGEALPLAWSARLTRPAWRRW